MQEIKCKKCSHTFTPVPRKADCIFTDPPYNIDYKGAGENTSEGIENDNLSDEDFKKLLDGSFKNYRRVVKPTAGLYVFHSAKAASQFDTALKEAGFDVKEELIWNKPSAGMGMGAYRRKHEPFFYACVEGETASFYGDRTHTTIWDLQDDEAKLLKWAKQVKADEAAGKTTVWTMGRDSTADYVHPTQKPVELVSQAIYNSSELGGSVLDTFLGSGSTLIAAEKTGRDCYGMELDPKYIDVAIERWCNYTENTTYVKNGEVIHLHGLQ